MLDLILLIWLDLRGNWFVKMYAFFIPFMPPWLARVVCLFTYVFILLDIRQKSSGAEGERLKEATNINKSLSTLGLVSSFTILVYCLFYNVVFYLKANLVGYNINCRLVIMNLVGVSNGKSHHVPYRDSKLTFLLQVVSKFSRSLLPSY